MPFLFKVYRKFIAQVRYEMQLLEGLKMYLLYEFDFYPVYTFQMNMVSALQLKGQVKIFLKLIISIRNNHILIQAFKTFQYHALCHLKTFLASVIHQAIDISKWH